MKYVTFIICLFFIAAQRPFAQEQPEELGQVRWLRDIETAKDQSVRSGKPVLILFQEIPGCITCRNYGNQVMSHPLVVEAIGQFFVPLAIYNNRGGKDHDVLSFFGEPAWNNPVVRIVDAKLKDICVRLSGDYTAYGLVAKINAALVTKGIPIPEYLKLLEQETLAAANGSRKAYVGMYCFWSGEKCYAQAPGVVGTRSGYMKGSEVVEVEYDPGQTSLDAIVNHGRSMHCADRLYSEKSSENVQSAVQIAGKGDFSVDKELKYYIHQSDYRYVPMTSMQAMKVNLALGSNGNPDRYLSPGQLDMYQSLKRNPERKFRSKIGMPLEQAWRQMKVELKG